MEKDAQIFVKHRLNVAFAKSKIDNKAPRYNIRKQYNTEKMVKDAFDVFERDKQNMKMLNEINNIQILGVSMYSDNQFDSMKIIKKNYFINFNSNINKKNYIGINTCNFN